MTVLEGSAVAVGIDAAVVVNHHVVVRRLVAAARPGAVVDDFAVPPTIARMALAKSVVWSNPTGYVPGWKKILNTLMVTYGERIETAIN